MTERTELLLCRTVGCTSPLARRPLMWVTGTLPVRICGWAYDRLNGA